MKRINSEFQTRYLSQEGRKLSNRDYFGYVEMDDFACYVLADSLDGDIETNSAKFVVESIIRCFVEHPTMAKGRLRNYLLSAHRELSKNHKGMRLKASVTVVVTDYAKMRYCYAGNSRFYLIRNNRYLIQTTDQSLTQTLMQEQKVALDQAAIHEARNNLYSYLGERGQPNIIVSKKVKLENGDILAQFTRGIWEHCSDEELLASANDAKEPGDILERVEDLILGRQEETDDIDNYSLAITFIGKTYQSPKKRFSLKKVLMIAIPIILVVGGISLGFYLRHRSIRNKQLSLAEYMESGETYLQYDNYKKASEEYAEAKKLASGLKQKEELAEADQYLKLADQIQLADEAMLAGEYQKAQELYISARDLSVTAGNVGKKYINQQLDQTRAYIDVYDYIAMGEEKEASGDMEGAVECYQQAKNQAAALYFGEGKEEALSKQAAVEQEVALAEQTEKTASQEAEAAKEEEEAAERELLNEQKTNDQKNAIDLENKGNELLAEEQYDSAITYYKTAQSIYIRLELPDLADGINEKIEAAQAGITSAKLAEEQKAAEQQAAKEQAAQEAAAGSVPQTTMQGEGQ